LFEVPGDLFPSQLLDLRDLQSSFGEAGGRFNNRPVDRPSAGAFLCSFDN
jgi:hypothetical protein